MAIKRQGVARQKRIKYAIYSVFLLAALGSATYYISKLKPAAPSVEWATIWPGTVKRGAMLVDVKGTGTPETAGHRIYSSSFRQPGKQDHGQFRR